jgi:hypothetical protein
MCNTNLTMRTVMKKRWWVFITILLVIHLGLFTNSEAGTVTWSVKNSGGTVVCSGTGNGTANLPATCGTALDFQGSGGTARIEAIDTGTNDILHLVNTKIVAKTNLTDYLLTFDHTFVPGPTSGDYTPIYYRTRMFGTISGAAPANKITVISTIEHPVGTVLLTAAPTPAPPPLAFDVWLSPSTTTAMTGNRKIIVKVKFSLQSTKNINFPGGRFVKVSAQISPDDPPGRDPEPKPEDTNDLLLQVQRMIENGGTACIGLSLSDGGCAGIHIVK